MDVVETIERAFEGVERPTNPELLHHDCADDMDLEPLFTIATWRDMTDVEVEGCYAALAFLSPAGFRYFIPAYLTYCVRNPESPAAVIDSTVWAFLPQMYDMSLRDFVASKYSSLDETQRAAVGTFLEFMVPHQPDAARALEHWNE